MPEYQLYCFAQSGNAYRAALMLNLIGADWKPVFVDFFKGGDAHAGVSRRGQRDGRGAGAGARRQEAHPVGRDPHLSGRALGTSSCRRARTSELEALRWIIFDNQKVNGFLGPYRFLKNFAKPPGDPAVLAFFKGRIDGNLGIVNKRLEGTPFLLGDRPTIADVSLARLSVLSGRGVRLRHRPGPPAIAAWRERMNALPGWKHPYDLMPGHPRAGEIAVLGALARQPAIDRRIRRRSRRPTRRDNR